MTSRPAESTGVAGSIAFLLCIILGVRDIEVLAALGTAVGALPALVTILVANGGIRGVARKLWQGR